MKTQMSYQNGVSYSFGSTSLDLDNLGVASAKIVELRVDADIDAKGDILMNPGRLVDGVDVSELKVEVDQVQVDVDAKIQEVEQRVDDVRTEMKDNYVTLATSQAVSGFKNFTGRVYFTGHGSSSVVVEGEMKVTTLILEMEGSANFLSPFTTHSTVTHKNRVYLENNVDALPGVLIHGVSLPGLNSSVIGLNLEVGDVKVKVADLGDQLLVLVPKVTAVETKVDDLTPQVSSLNTQVGVLNSKAVIVDGKLVNLDGRVAVLEAGDSKTWVTLGSNQTITGVKTFSAPITVAAANGRIVSGIGVRSSNRAQTMLLSNGDGVAEIFLGSDSDGSGITDANYKWCFSSRDKTDGRLIFYRAPGYTEGAFDEVMAFRSESKSACVIEMYKRVKFSGGFETTGVMSAPDGIRVGPPALSTPLNFHFEEIFTVAWTAWTPYRSTEVRVVRTGAMVCMKILALSPQAVTVQSITGVGTLPILPERYRPRENTRVPCWIIVNNNRTMMGIQVTYTGSLNIATGSAVSITGQSWGWDTFDISYNVL